MGYSIKVRNPQVVVDVRKVHAAIRPLGFAKQDQRTAAFLSTLSFYRAQTFEFIANERGWDRLRVLCPNCGNRKQVLVAIEGGSDFRCRRCHHLATQSRCHSNKRNALQAYGRVWVLRAVYEQKLITATGRRKAILLNKIGRLRRASPFAMSLFDEGVVPVDQLVPGYFAALAQVL